MSIFSLKTSVFSVKTSVFHPENVIFSLVDEIQMKKTVVPDIFVTHFCNYFRDYFRFFFEFLEGNPCRYSKPVRNYGVLIGSKFSRKNRFDSVFNRIFDYIHGTHCLSVQDHPYVGPFNSGRYFQVIVVQRPPFKRSPQSSLYSS